MLELINTAALKFLEPISLKHTYTTIVEEAAKAVKGESGLILLEENKQLKTVYGSTPEARAFKVRKKGFAYRSYVKRQTLVIVPEEFKKLYPDIYRAGVKRVYFIPLSYKNKSIGVLVIRSNLDQDIDNRGLQALKLLGSLATLAIRNIQLYDETREALDLRDDFISLAAHELRTPLTTMYGYIQLLNKKMEGRDHAEAKWVKELGKQSRRLNNMVEELLQMNRIKAGKVHYVFEQQDIEHVVRKAKDIIQREYSDASFTIQNAIAGESYSVIGDERLLTQVFVQLFENAMKFSPDVKKVAVEIYKEVSRIVVKITDYGIGISRKDLPFVFDDFYKSETNMRKGMGIGLFIARAIVEKHKGSIKIRSKLQKGTTVEISLPYIRL